MNVNRVDYNGGTLIDLTSDTVTAADLPAGVTAHDRSGTPITGTANYQPRTLDSSVTIGAETETTVEGAIGELAGLVPSAATPATNKLATAGDVNGEEITITATSSPLTTTAAHPRKIAIFGKSEVVDGDIHSVGEGWTTVDLGTLEWGYSTSYSHPFFFSTISTKKNTFALCDRYKCIDPQPANDFGNTANNDDMAIGTLNPQIYIRNDNYTDAATFKAAMSGIILAYQLADPTQGNAIAVKTDDTTGIDGTMAVLETGTPLRGITGGAQDVAVWDGMSGGVIKRCEVINGEVVALTNPIEIPFTASENNSFAALHTYSPQTAIAINDNPEFEVEAYAGTANGKAVAAVQNDLQEQINDKITTSALLTLTTVGWSNNTQTVAFSHDTSRRNVIDVTPADIPAWGAAGVYASAETSAGITFTCSSVPASALTFRVTSIGVS